MKIEELNRCLRKFYVSARKQDGGFYNKATLTSIRSAIDRHLRNEPNNKKFSIISSPEFTEANKALNSFLKNLSKTGQIRSTIHKPPLSKEAIVKLYEAGELVEVNSLSPRKLQQTAWFYITLYFGRRGRENQRQLTSSSIKLCKTSSESQEYFELDRQNPGAVFSTKNHQGGLDGSDDPSDGKMFECKGSPRCPVAVMKKYLSHLNPACQALFQKPLSGSKFNPSVDNVWYCAVPLGHNALDNMMKNMCIQAHIDPPYTNHSVRSTTVTVLSSMNMSNRHIRAVTGHKSDSSLESYNNRPTIEQFEEMSTAITEFVHSDHRAALRSLTNVVPTSRSTAQQSTTNQLAISEQVSIEESHNFSSQSSQHYSRGMISGGVFTNCTFNFNSK